MINEKSFYPGFLEACTDLELVGLQHDLRRDPDDKPYLDQVLGELSRRLKERNKMAVPILGQPADLVIWYPTVIVRCKCQDKTIQLIVLTGLDNASSCPKCGNIYSVGGFSVTDGKVVPAIKFVIPTPKSQVQ